MFKKTLLALAAGGAIALSALTGSAGSAKADTSVHIGIGVPGVHFSHSTHRSRCWLPERHLCGPGYGHPYHGRPVYGVPVYRAPIYGWPVYHGGYWAPP
ncbi:MAG: hypothetical protein ACOC71_06685, partial [Hyphomicrobiales bacterium]